jgi:hypothetical protein
LHLGPELENRIGQFLSFAAAFQSSRLRTFPNWVDCRSRTEAGAGRDSAQTKLGIVSDSAAVALQSVGNASLGEPTRHPALGQDSLVGRAH